MIPHVWTTDHEAILRRMWSNHSSREIMLHFEALGHAVTRNSVIGKAHRLGLAIKARIEPRPPRPQSLSAAAAPRKPGPSRQIRPPKPFSDAPEVSTVSFVPRVVETGPLHLSLLELTEATCKYEVGGGHDPAKFTFCGHPSDGTPYCESHNRLCHLDPKKSRSYYHRAA